MLLCPGLRWCVWLSTGKYFKEAISTLIIMIDLANICPVGDWDRGRGRRMPWGWKWGTASRRSTGTTSAASRRSTGPGLNWSKVVMDVRLSPMIGVLETWGNRQSINQQGQQVQPQGAPQGVPSARSDQNKFKYLSILNDHFYSTQAPQPQNQLAPRRY